MSELLNILDFTAKQAHMMATEHSVAETPIVIDGVSIIPVSKISCGFSFGGSNIAGKNDKTIAGAGAKVSKTPLHLIAVADGNVQILEVDEENVKKNGLVVAVKPLVSALKKKK